MTQHTYISGQATKHIRFSLMLDGKCSERALRNVVTLLTAHADALVEAADAGAAEYMSWFAQDAAQALARLNEPGALTPSEVAAVITALQEQK